MTFFPVSRLEAQQIKTLNTVDEIKKIVLTQEIGWKPSKLQATRPPLPSEIFTGRVEYLEKMKETFSIQASSTERRKQRRFVLYGMGGAGKTELALKFLDQNRDW